MMLFLMASFVSQRFFSNFAFFGYSRSEKRKIKKTLRIKTHRQKESSNKSKKTASLYFFVNLFRIVEYKRRWKSVSSLQRTTPRFPRTCHRRAPTHFLNADKMIINQIRQNKKLKSCFTAYNKKWKCSMSLLMCLFFLFWFLNVRTPELRVVGV